MKMMCITSLKRIALIGLYVLVCLTPSTYAEEPSEQTQFLRSVFAYDVPDAKTLWLNKNIKQDIKKILRHDYAGLRIRYWQEGPRTLWVLNEIGKYKPITVGVVINESAIEQLNVLTYRESHGWEVKHDFFTKQFIGARLPKLNKLDRQIDGISGATLSVRALKKLARLALYLDKSVTTQ